MKKCCAHKQAWALDFFPQGHVKWVHVSTFTFAALLRLCHMVKQLEILFSYLPNPTVFSPFCQFGKSGLQLLPLSGRYLFGGRGYQFCPLVLKMCKALDSPRELLQTKCLDAPQTDSIRISGWGLVLRYPCFLKTSGESRYSAVENNSFGLNAA